MNGSSTPVRELIVDEAEVSDEDTSFADSGWATAARTQAICEGARRKKLKELKTSDTSAALKHLHAEPAVFELLVHNVQMRVTPAVSLGSLGGSTSTSADVGSCALRNIEAKVVVPVSQKASGSGQGPGVELHDVALDQGKAVLVTGSSSSGAKKLRLSIEPQPGAGDLNGPNNLVSGALRLGARLHGDNAASDWSDYKRACVDVQKADVAAADQASLQNSPRYLEFPGLADAQARRTA